MVERLLLIDGNSLLHRAFHALPTLTSPTGELTNAAYGFTSMLLSAYRDLRPRYTVAAFDTPAPTFRRAEYEAYKATRPPAPEGLAHQFKRVFQLLEALHVPIYRVDGFEADDLLGTLARQASERELEVVILSGDLDAAQLVDARVRLLVPIQGISRTRLYDVAAVQERYGLLPSQIPDFKALRGDASDNIPGIPGIGDKTASKLLAEYGSVEGLLSRLEALPPKLRQAVEPYADQARLAKGLASIVRDVPVELDLPTEAPGVQDRAKLLDLFHELGFRSLVDRFDALGDGASGEAPRAERSGQLALFEAPAWAESSERVVADLAALRELVARVAAGRRAVVHLVTSGEGPMRASLVGLVLKVDEEPPAYIPLGHAAQRLSWETVRPVVQPLLEDEGLPKVAHNAKDQIIVLGRYGVELRGLSFDTMLAAYLLQSGQRAVELRDLAWSRLQVELSPLAALTGAGKKAIPVSELEPARVAEQAARAAELVAHLEPLLARDLEADQLSALFSEVELPLAPMLAEMERNGVGVDVDYLHRLSRRLYAQIQELEAEVYRHVGHHFNLNSNQQLSAVLFQELRLPPARKTRTGHISTGAEVLEELRGLHPVVELLLEYRQLQKLKSTYVDALPALVNPETGRVHTSFNQTVAATGRLSSSDPNLQNIPIRTELGREVRRAFVAGSPGNVLLSADYSQIELRILAHVTQDPRLLEAFAQGEDIHAATAAEVLGLPIEQVTSEQRRLAKMVNFGVLYGMSEYGLAARTDLPHEQAAGFIDRYFQRFATVKAYQERVIREVLQQGYATTLRGRRRYIPEVGSPVRIVREAGVRQAINLPIQGTAADIAKIAMVRVHRALHDGTLPPEARMLLQVHDELVFELPQTDLQAFVPVLRELMEGAMPLSAPLRVDIKVGPNWDEMKLVPPEAGPGASG